MSVNRCRSMVLALVVLSLAAAPAFANHSWNGYHWARQSNPFTLKINDNLDPIWESYLSVAVSDWNKSTVLDYSIIWQNPLSSQRKCSSAAGVVEICNETYGQNGWLGIAGISVSGSHITKGYTKLNDTYYAMARYNTPAWRQMVTCQEIAHDFGLAHQDENFSNTNLGSCMDYTNDPTGNAGTNGTLSNEHPNQHDFDMIQSIYNHNDSTSTISSIVNVMASAASRPITDDDIRGNAENWGTALRYDDRGRATTFAKITGVASNGEIEIDITHVFWTPDANPNRMAAQE